MNFKKVDGCKFKADQVNIKIEMKGRVGSGILAVVNKMEVILKLFLKGVISTCCSV